MGDPTEQYRNITTLEGIDITGRTEKEDGIVFEAEWKPEKESQDECPECGHEDPPLRGRGHYKWRKVRDMRREGKPVGIRLAIQRFECKDCNGVFKARHPGIVDGRKMTRTLHEHLQKKSLQWWETFSELDGRFGLGKDTVRKIFNSYTDRLDEEYSPEPPRVLGIDGVYVETKGETWTLLADIEEKTVIELLKAHDAGSVESKLRQLGARGETEVVVMDMSRVCRPAVERVLPQARIVVDRWHVTKRAEQAMSDVKSDVEGEEMMDEWRERRSGISSAEELPAGHQFVIGGTQPITLRPSEDPLDRMEAAYRAKNEFERIFELSDRDEAVRRLREWEAKLPDSIREAFEGVTGLLKGRWEEQILNYFDHKYTNGAVENLNKTVNEIDDRTDGCKFKTLRRKAVFGPAHKTEVLGKGKAMHFEGILKKRPPQAPRKQGRRRKVVDHGVPFEALLEWMEK